MESRMQPGRYTGTLLLADISGYTSFLDNVREAHERDAFADGQIPNAYNVVSGLLDGIARNVEPPFTFVKFEGDAVFAVADSEASPRAGAMVDLIEGCYQDFVERLGRAGVVWTCTCDACSRMGTLDLKFVIHYGDYFAQSIGSQLEVLGPDVNLAHRLLKNKAAAAVDTNAYSLFTEPVVAALSLRLDGAAHVEENIDDMPAVGVYVLPLRR